MGKMSEIHIEACETIYDILCNRLCLPSEESTYELAVDIFEASMEKLDITDMESAEVLNLYEKRIDSEIDTIRDLCKNGYPYNTGYFNALHDSKAYLNTCKKLVKGDSYV